MATWMVLEVLGGPDTEHVAHFHIDRFMEPLYRFRCHSGPLALFALRRYSGEGDVPLRYAMHHKCSIETPKQHAALFRIAHRTRWKRLYFATVNIFEI